MLIDCGWAVLPGEVVWCDGPIQPHLRSTPLPSPTTVTQTVSLSVTGWGDREGYTSSHFVHSTHLWDHGGWFINTIGLSGPPYVQDLP